MEEIEPEDPVRVKDGTVHPDDEAWDIGGWQGWVKETWENEDGQPMVLLKWDSLSLEELSEEYIIDCIKKDLSWDEMILYLEDIEPAAPRDTPKDVEDKLEELKERYKEVQDRYRWAGQGEQEERIRKILEGADGDSRSAILRRWEDYLEEKIDFPFEAVIDQTVGLRNNEFTEDSIVGDQVRVHEFFAREDGFGLIVRISSDNDYPQMPLINLRAKDETTPAHQAIEDYRFWDANS